MKKMLLVLFVTIGIAAFSGCGKREADMPAADPATIEKEANIAEEKKAKARELRALEEENLKTTVAMNMGRARQNAMYLAKGYLSADATYRGWSAIPATDSTISSRCPAGDGFATIELVFRKQDGQRITENIKCSTYDENIGCMSSERFVQSKYANAEGACNRELPRTLPSIIPAN